MYIYKTIQEVNIGDLVKVAHMMNSPQMIVIDKETVGHVPLV